MFPPALQTWWITEGHYGRPHLLLTMARRIVPTGLMALRSQRSANPLRDQRQVRVAGARRRTPLSGWGHKRSGQQEGSLTCVSLLYALCYMVPHLIRLKSHWAVRRNTASQKRSLTFRLLSIICPNSQWSARVQSRASLTSVFVPCTTYPVSHKDNGLVVHCLPLGMPVGGGSFVYMCPYLLFWGDLNGPKVRRTLKATFDWPTNSPLHQNFGN